ncbi:hypothetical protein FOZ62_026560 [Perkinsus olseni]|nr:hypothetical protein FOZ62_026560 [Perkinsus olseni]
MAIILSWFISVIFLASVEAQIRGKYVLYGADVDLQLTLISEEHWESNDDTPAWVVYWLYRCRPDDRPYLVGPFPVIQPPATNASGPFGIDYGKTNLIGRIRRHCPPLYDIFDGDLKTFRYHIDGTVLSTLGNEVAAFARGGNLAEEAPIPYQWYPSFSSNYGVIHLLYVREERLRAELWVTCGSTPSSWVATDFRINPVTVRATRHLIDPADETTFNEFKDKLEIACGAALESGDLVDLTFAPVGKFTTRFEGRSITLVSPSSPS